LLAISTALSASHVGELHIDASALYKYPAARCKNQLKRSTRPSFLFYFPVLKRCHNGSGIAVTPIELQSK